MSKKLFLNTQSSRIPVEKLISYLRLNNSIVDETGNFTYSKVGTSYANGIFSGIANESINFTALTDRLTVPDSDSFSFVNKPFSISLCLNLTNIGVLQTGLGIRYLISKRGDVPTNNAEWQVSLNTDGTLFFRLWDNSTGGNITVTGTSVLSNSTNYHIVCTYDGGSSSYGLKIFVNGVLETVTYSTSGTFIAMENLGEKLSIGGVDWSSGNSVSPLGRIDGIGIWNTRLKRKQIEAIYNRQSAGFEIL